MKGAVKCLFVQKQTVLATFFMSIDKFYLVSKENKISLEKYSWICKFGIRENMSRRC